MRRREFLNLLGIATATTKPITIRAQQAIPLIGFLSGRSLPEAASTVGAFREALADAGYVEAKNVTIEYRWARYTRGDYPTA